MKALVTGATGFIGGNLTRELLEEGFQVRALVRRESDKRNIEGLDIEMVTGDLLDVASLKNALKGCEVLFHCAALYTLWARDRQALYSTNVGGTRNILNAALEKGVKRVVYTSTASTIGLSKGGVPSTEEVEPSPQDLIGHYKRSKYIAELEALKLCRAGLPLVVVNPTAPVGPGDVKPTPTGQIILDFLKGKMPAYLDTGLNLIHVKDVARGHILALEKGRVGERYILGNTNMSFKAVLDTLAEITGRSSPRIRVPYLVALGFAYVDELSATILGRSPRAPITGVRMAKKPMYFDATKAVRELGLPQTPVREALKEAVDWFYEQERVKKGAAASTSQDELVKAKV